MRFVQTPAVPRCRLQLSCHFLSMAYGCGQTRRWASLLYCTGLSVYAYIIISHCGISTRSTLNKLGNMEAMVSPAGLRFEISHSSHVGPLLTKGNGLCMSINRRGLFVSECVSCMFLIEHAKNVCRLLSCSLVELDQSNSKNMHSKIHNEMK